MIKEPAIVSGADSGYSRERCQTCTAFVGDWHYEGCTFAEPSNDPRVPAPDGTACPTCGGGLGHWPNCDPAEPTTPTAKSLADGERDGLTAQLVQIEREAAAGPLAVALSVALAKSQISADVARGRVPAGVASFAELHDFVDANEYGELCGVVYETLRGDGDDVPDALTDFGNAVQNAVDAWIKEGGLSA